MADGVDRSELTAEELAEARRYPLSIEWSAEDNTFIVSVPDLPGVYTHGATREEAAAMGDEVIAASLTAMRRRGHPIPPPSLYTGSEAGGQPAPFSASHVKEARRNLGVSQEEFARLFNVSVATVRSWEEGVSRPDGAAARLLGIAERHPETILEAASISEQVQDRVA